MSSLCGRSIDLMRPVRPSTGGTVVEATSLRSEQPTVVDLTTEQQPETHPQVSQEREQSSAELRLLMDLADRYAHQLVAADDAPPGVLLLVHGSDVDVVTLGSLDAEVRALPRVLARSRPSSAALVTAAEGASGGINGRVVVILGETSDGLREERQFRVRGFGRTRRLARLPDDAAKAPPLTLRLFPSWAVPTA